MKGATQNPAVLQNPALLIDIGNIKSLKGILGKKIETIEGLSENGMLHPIQDSFVENGAIQCGYCTPGMILSAKALLAKNDNPTNEEIKYGMAGNFCRCTGYKKIIDAVHEAAGKATAGWKLTEINMTFP